MSKIDKLRLVAFGFLVALLCVHGEAQTNLRLVSQTRFVTRIVFDCVTSRYPKRRLARVVRAAMKGLDAGDIGVLGNKAVAFDLNKDSKLEYFIPLDCGGTGNCSWGIFALNPPLLLGIMPAREIYIQQSAGWPILVTYVHSSATDGVISAYKYTRDRYVKTGEDFEVSADRKEFPKSMEKTHTTCEPGNSSRRKINGRRSHAHE